MKDYGLKNVIFLDEKNTAERKKFGFLYRIKKSNCSFSVELDNNVLDDLYIFFSKLEYNVYVSIQELNKEMLFLIFDSEEEAAEFALLI